LRLFRFLILRVLIGNRVFDPTRIIVLFAVLASQDKNVCSGQLSSAHRTNKILDTPLVDAGGVEDMSTNCGPDCCIELKLLQTNRAHFSFAFVLYGNVRNWHKSVKVGYVNHCIDIIWLPA